jgi:hypothetical protein
MDARTLAAMRKYGCVYIQAVGGAAAISAAAVKRVSGVSLLHEFGAAEAVWHFDVEDFRGVVAMDSLGCSLFGISNDVAMQIVGVGFIVSVIQDSLETALNSSGDVIFTATAEFLEWKKEGKELPI